MMASQKEWLDLYQLNSIITNKIATMAAKVSAIAKTAMLVVVAIK